MRKADHTHQSVRRDARPTITGPRASSIGGSVARVLNGLVERPLGDRRRSILLKVGQHLFGSRDFDRVAVAEITSRGRCSVGGFYRRFPEKLFFIDEVIRRTFDGAIESAERDLDPLRLGDMRAHQIVRAIVEHVVETLKGETAGVLRTAIKRGQSEPDALRPMLDYRSLVFERAVLLLADRLPQHDGHRKLAVRTATQIVFASVIESTIHDQGPLRSGSQTLTDELSQMMNKQLGFVIRKRRAPRI